MTSFLQTAIVFLLLTNMISALVAFYAMKASQIHSEPQSGAGERARAQACKALLAPQLSGGAGNGGGAMTGA